MSDKSITYKITPERASSLQRFTGCAEGRRRRPRETMTMFPRILPPSKAMCPSRTPDVLDLRYEHMDGQLELSSGGLTIDQDFGSRFMPHFGHLPGALFFTSGCIGQV